MNLYYLYICTDIKGTYMFSIYTYIYNLHSLFNDEISKGTKVWRATKSCHHVMSRKNFDNWRKHQPIPTHKVQFELRTDMFYWWCLGDVLDCFQHELVHTWSSFLIDDVWCPNLHQKGQHQNQNLFARKKGSLSVDGGLPQNPVTATDCPHIVSILSCYQGWSHRFLIPSSECATIQGTLALATCVVSILYSWNGWETGLGKTLL